MFILVSMYTPIYERMCFTHSILKRFEIVTKVINIKEKQNGYQR